MNGEATNALKGELKRYITGEIRQLEEPIQGLVEYQAELRRDVDEWAAKLRDVVEALVQADGALSQRISRLEDESEAQFFAEDPSATQPAPPKRRRFSRTSY